MYKKTADISHKYLNDPKYKQAIVCKTEAIVLEGVTYSRTKSLILENPIMKFTI